MILTTMCGIINVRKTASRLRFGDGKNAAPFPSMVVIFRCPEIIIYQPHSWCISWCNENSVGVSVGVTKIRGDILNNTNDLAEYVNSIPNAKIQDAILKANVHIDRGEKIVCAVSGGSDSDIMVDMLHTLDKKNNVIYVWCNTGLEYEATKRHLSDLEAKYNINIIQLNAIKPIPLAIKKYGVPFLSKRVSDMISRLQKHNFQWEDEPYDVLIEKYPKCQSALKWWCNAKGENSHYNIAQNKWLKEFMVQNPPTFHISDQCCQWAKKSVVHKYCQDNNADIQCVGVRKSEGGVRTVYKSCFTPATDDDIAQFRPIFWLENDDKQCYKECRNITYSDCYEVWGMKRTGCAACPFGKNFEFELECIAKYEPKLFNAVNNIFADSYEYTRNYREFQAKMNQISSKEKIT